MDAALEASIQSKPQVKGFLCADQNGLLITGTFININIRYHFNC